jgi:hypothetical protein
MPTLSVTVSAQSVQRIVSAFTKLANNMSPDPPVVVDQKYVEDWMQAQLQHVVHQQEGAATISQLPPPAPIT